MQHQMKTMQQELKEIRVDVSHLKDDVGYLKGRDQERFYQEKASGIFGKYLKKIKVLDKGELLEQMDTAKALTDEEWREMIDLDLAVEAVTRKTGQPVVLAMEVSWAIDFGDVERAVHQATLMRERGLPALPVVAGNGVLPEAKGEAHLHQVLVVLDGKLLNKEGLE